MTSVSVFLAILRDPGSPKAALTFVEWSAAFAVAQVHYIHKYTLC
jgi:hypothetical protein